MNTNIQTNFQICISVPLTNVFQISLDDSKRKQNKIWVDQGSEFYKKFLKKWLEELKQKCIHYTKKEMCGC